MLLWGQISLSAKVSSFNVTIHIHVCICVYIQAFWLGSLGAMMLPEDSSRESSVSGTKHSFATEHFKMRTQMGRLV